MKTDTPQTILLKNYTPPPFLVDTVDLDVDFRPQAVTVTARLALRRNPAAEDPRAPLTLDGDELETLDVAIDGHNLAADRYSTSEVLMTIAGVPDAFELRTITRIRPDTNTK